MIFKIHDENFQYQVGWRVTCTYKN